MSLRFQVNPPNSIKNVIMFSDQIFESGTLVAQPENPSNILDVPIITDKTIECQIAVKVLVGNSAHAEEYVCIHKKLQFKKFGSFKGIPLDQQIPPPEGQVTFDVQDRPNRILLWAEKVFNLDKNNHSYEVTNSGMVMKFVDVKTGQPLLIEAQTTPQGLQVSLGLNDLKIAGDILTDLCQSLNITNLNS